MSRAGLVFASLALAATAALGQGAGWSTYANGRFGTTVDFPAILSQRDQPPANGDGQGFRTADGRTRLLVYGSFNVENETPRQMMQSRRTAGTTYSYTEANARFFVLSGIREGRISYLRCALSDKAKDIVGCFEIEYPAGDAADWNPRVERISRSLRFGKPW